MGGHAHVVTSVAMDLATQRTAATSAGVIDAAGYLGAAATGWGTGWMVNHWGWQSAFVMWAAGAVAGGAVIALLHGHRITGEGTP